MISNETLVTVFNDRFESIVKKNPRFSLRSLAMKIGINSSSLSKYLKGKRPINGPVQEKLCEVLKVSMEDIRKHELEKQFEAKSESYQAVQEDILDVLADAAHFTVLEMIKLDDFRPEISWIARRLQLAEGEVRGVVERLVL